MNAIAKSGERRLPGLSPALDRAVSSPTVAVFGDRETSSDRAARMKRGDPCPSMVIRLSTQEGYSSAVIAEAQRILPDLDRSMLPLSGGELQTEVGRFFDLVNAGVANPQDETALGMRKMAMLAALADMPGAAWSAQVRASAMRKFRFFPSVAEVVEHFDEQLGPIRDKIARIRTVARTTPAPAEPERRRPSEEERRAVAEMMAARNAEVAARQAEDERNRKHGGHTPAGAEGLTGRALAAALRRALPAMTGDLAAVTRDRIGMLDRAADMADALRGASDRQE